MPDETTDDLTDDRIGDSTPEGTSPEESSALEVEQALHEARQRLADIPVEVVVVNHAMGLYELAAIHLSADPPDLDGAGLAIDALAALVEGLGDRLGDDVTTLRDALAAIRMAYVGVARATRPSDPS